MIWLRRMLLGGFVVNLIYMLFMIIQPGLTIWSYILISGLLTGVILSFLIRKGHI
jgi:hypothetical protein